MRRAKRRGSVHYFLRLAYLIDEKQLTKDRPGAWLVIIWKRRQETSQSGREKIFTRRSEFPSWRFGPAMGVGERPGKLQGDQVVALGVLQRSTLARRLRATLGRAAKAANGALGISSRTCAEDGRSGERPPAYRRRRRSERWRTPGTPSPAPPGFARRRESPKASAATPTLCRWTPDLTHTPSFAVFGRGNSKHLRGQILS
jgi:hypothetical protein